MKSYWQKYTTTRKVESPTNSLMATVGTSGRIPPLNLAGKVLHVECSTSIMTSAQYTGGQLIPVAFISRESLVETLSASNLATSLLGTQSTMQVVVQEHSGTPKPGLMDPTGSIPTTQQMNGTNLVGPKMSNVASVLPVSNSEVLNKAQHESGALVVNWFLYIILIVLYHN